MIKENRNYGIDLLRIFSMLMVVILHVLGSGGILYSSNLTVTGGKVAWLIEIACYCAVNCYAIVSGFVGYKSKYKLSNIIMLWLQVFFYTLLISLLFWMMGWQGFNISSLKSAFLPVMNNEYWYFTAYFIMYLFIPILNIALDKLSKKQMGMFLGFGFLFLSLIPTLLMTDPFHLMKGYSAFWLMYLYLLGGFLHKYEVFSKGKTLDYLVYYLCLVLFTFLSKINIEFLTVKIFGEIRYNMMFIDYTSPTILLCGIFLVGAFSKMKFNNIYKKIISFFAPISFGVYLIHNNNLILNRFWNGAFSYLNDEKTIKMTFMIFVWALGVYFVCSLIDYVRLKLFKLFKIKDIVVWIENKFFN